MFIKLVGDKEGLKVISADYSGWDSHESEDGIVVKKFLGDRSFSAPGLATTCHILISQGKLEVGRSFSGESPIYYAINGKFVLLSDSAARLAEEVYAPLSVQGCYEYIFFEYPGPRRTLYDAVHAVLNSQRVQFTICRDGGIKSECFDEFYFPDEEFTAANEVRLAADLREKITAAHAKRVGSSNAVLLSGGIDSQVMAIALSRDLAIKELLAGTFSVKGAVQQETKDAQYTARQLGLEWVPIEVDPEMDFDWGKILQANSPYIGAIAMQQFLPKLAARCGLGSTVFAGQDTRLHTPALGTRDQWLWRNFFRYRGFPKVTSAMASVVGQLFKSSNDSMFVKRLLNLFAASPDFDHFLINRYFHVRRFPFNVQSKYFETVMEELCRELRGVDPLTPRATYNSIVRANWRRQYLFDIGHMVEAAGAAELHCALPFYDADLTTFSSRLPFALATKLSAGRAGHEEKVVKVNKYLLRKAYEKELDRSLIFRDKAVCATNYLFLNGSLRPLLQNFMRDSRVANTDFGRHLHVPDIQRICLHKDGQWNMTDNWLGNIVFNALVVWSLMLK